MSSDTSVSVCMPMVEQKDVVALYSFVLRDDGLVYFTWHFHDRDHHQVMGPEPRVHFDDGVNKLSIERCDGCWGDGFPKWELVCRGVRRRLGRFECERSWTMWSNGELE